MIKLNEIKIMNDTMIVYLKKLGLNYKRNEIIKKILTNDDCFFKMNKEDALLILYDIGIKDNTEEIYSQLISREIYYDLYQKGKINKDDSELVIKYELYDSKNIFKTIPEENKIIDNDTQITNVKKNSFLKILLKKIKRVFIKK